MSLVIHARVDSGGDSLRVVEVNGCFEVRFIYRDLWDKRVYSSITEHKTLSLAISKFRLVMENQFSEIILHKNAKGGK